MPKGRKLAAKARNEDLRAETGRPGLRNEHTSNRHVQCRHMNVQLTS